MDSIREYWIKNMVCRRCLKVIKQELHDLGITILSLELGKLTVKAPEIAIAEADQKVVDVLHSNGFEIAKSEEEMIVEKIKIALISLVADIPINNRGKTSDYLANIVHREYKVLSKIFSKNENITIEKYFIKLKIEKVKELIQLRQHTFSDIAYLLDYSSVNHLSRQFKEIMGMSMTDYKNDQAWERNFFDEII
ncbi:helix-turn-helix domain-containing protein [Maribacter polysiphoniae]|uniref:Helix-turn-helix domain-containing protein n=2 Tax=Flavobacteriaceae TaxID=49546 RepID=A0A316E2A8_9FLAO|nr:MULTISPECIES: helix-turn-helix domain-containing protein [Flavobacteriaceae]MBD1260703.1 helix-turn-helix domain-containing protein [Maribacter polysiphoniae]PWK24166.1 helix-turn-helix protein [Maribacter polysiphoniae]RPG38182.1 MAG: helix-turn-helix domain-containing protein [Muricauda sp. TMED12]RYC51642.1 regulatory protein [Allomuricauda olearia]|tara:strand:- start:15924 stop:16505 length:582 start_codon:yes stop_codon:yes gene_type:complete